MTASAGETTEGIADGVPGSARVEAGMAVVEERSPGSGDGAMRLSVLGAGAIGPAMAALAASRGHPVTLWSPSGRGTEGIVDGLRAEGVLEGRFPARVARDLSGALRHADAAVLAVPAYALPALLPRLARALPPDLPLLISPAAALAPLALDALRAADGAPRRRAPVGAMTTTPVTARRLGPDRVRVAVRRAAVDVSAVPAAAGPAMAGLASTLFGHRSPVGSHVLEAALGNANPIIHAAMALTNAARIEAGEAWSQYAAMTPGVCGLMERMAAERAALAGARGVAVLGLEEALHRANGVPLAPLHEMARTIAASRGPVHGPATPDTRYVLEDVPFGLSFYLWLSRAGGPAMPVTDAVVTALEALWGRDLRGNPLLDGLDPAHLDDALRHGFGRD